MLPNIFVWRAIYDFKECPPGSMGPDCAFNCPYPSYGEDCYMTCVCSADLCDFHSGCINNNLQCKSFLCNLYVFKLFPLITSHWSLLIIFNLIGDVYATFGIFHIKFSKQREIFTSELNTNTLHSSFTELVYRHIIWIIQ